MARIVPRNIKAIRKRDHIIFDNRIVNLKRRLPHNLIRILEAAKEARI